MLIVPSNLPFPPSKTVIHSAYDWPLEKDYLEKNIVCKLFSGFKWQAIRMPKIWADFFVATCTAIIKHVKKHQEEFKRFDLLFGDSPPDCHVIIAELLVLPRIDIKPAYAMRLLMELGQVSYIPSIASSTIGEMSFMERLQNLFSFGSLKAVGIYQLTRFGDLKAEFNIMPERHFQESIHMAEMTLIMGHIALEYPQPLLPGIERNQSLLHYDYEGIVNDATG